MQRGRDSDHAAPGSGVTSSCIGREPELAAVRALHERAERERCGLVALVTGGPGVGKTRLGQR